MNKQKNKPYVKDVFDIDHYIKQGKNKIFLIAGVSSGKSTWVKDVLSKKGNVLFVTSRKAKAEADIKNSNFTDVINFYTAERQTLLTNAGLARRIENMCISDTSTLDKFVDYFDYIVIDEVHSIASDSPFSDSAYTVLSFIEYIANLGKTIVCMTGTPAPVYKYFVDNDWAIVDYLNICNHVHPSLIMIIRKSATVGLIKTHSSSKVIYFANRTDTIKKMCKKMLDDGVFIPSEIAISVSKSKEKEVFDSLKKVLKNDEAFETIKKTSAEAYEHIVSNHALPEFCKILFSTSTLKEGIDIDNENILMFCENHILSNLIQFFGRVRKSKCKVYIIEDSVDHKTEHSELLYNYAVKEELTAANSFLLTNCNFKENPVEMLERYDFIKYVAKNPYINFDYLKNEFCIFSLKYDEEKRLIKNKKWKEKLKQYCERYNIDLYDFTQKRFRQEALRRMAQSGKKYFDKEELICSLLFVGYGIENKQYTKINKELEQKEASIRVFTAVETRGKYRGKTYWQICCVKK